MRIEIPRKSVLRTSQMRRHEAVKQDVIFQRGKADHGLLLNLCVSALRGCSVGSAHGAQRKVAVCYPQVSVKRCHRPSRAGQTFKYPIYSFVRPDALFVPVVARFEIQPGVAVNRACMSKQLCQAESECPLLVRLRSRSLSKSGSCVKRYGGRKVATDKRE